MSDQNEQRKKVQIKVDDQTLKGRYANAMQVAHTKEEFVFDFITLTPPQGVVSARVITSPGHAKRMLIALQENIGKYEAVYGKIEESAAPDVSMTIN